MLVLPMVLGLAVAGRMAAPALYAACGMLLVFLARSASVPTASRLVQGRALPPGVLARRLAWTALYGAGAVACVAAALAGVGTGTRSELGAALIVPLALGSVHAMLGLAGRDRGLGAEVLGMIGLAAGAPLVAVAAGAPLDRRTIGAGALSLAYFLSSLAFVRAYRRLKSAGSVDTESCLWAHAAIVAALAALWGGGCLPAAAWAAFVPVLLRTAWGLARPPRNLATLGWREVGVAATFTIAAVAALLS
jgi:hypothetical protein